MTIKERPLLLRDFSSVLRVNGGCGGWMVRIKCMVAHLGHVLLPVCFSFSNSQKRTNRILIDNSVNNLWFYLILMLVNSNVF